MSVSIENGRRMRAMEAKRRRIAGAAAQLFESQGFAAVTTQQISDRADVAAGTLFRYAASKSELLLMVYNGKLSEALRNGLARASVIDDPFDAVIAMIDPLLESAVESPENSAIYQRELLFGSPEEKFRQEGLALVNAFERDIASRLLGADSRSGVTLDPEAARVGSSSIFAVVHLAIARMFTGAHAGHDTRHDLRNQIGQILCGLASPTAGADGQAPGQPSSVDINE